MQRLIFSSALFLAFGGATVFAQPVVTELQNNYSYIQPGLPNYGIPPGSLFIIKGTGLASTTNTAEQFPLTTNLNGTTVSVTVNGVTTNPTLYYILPTQIGAVLPEATPVGTGTLTVSNGGQSSSAVPIQVVQSDFGILTYNGAGFGPAYAFDVNYVPITATHPATPGELIVFWGTGVGPDPANDDKTEPQQANNLTNIDMQVYIGGVSATVYYKGRSPYPGVDEVFVYVPASGAPTGCYTSVVTQSGSLTSNYTTIPVAGTGAANCGDPIAIETSWNSLLGRSSVNIGELSVIGKTAQTALGPQDSSQATGIFKTDSAAEIYSELVSDGFVSIGSCIVSQNISLGAPAVLTAGSSLTLTGPGNEQAALNYTAGNNPPYAASLAADFIPAAGGTFTFSGTSGAQVGNFNTAVTVPPPVVWSNMSAASNINVSQGLTLNWTAGSLSGFVLIYGDSLGAAGIDVSFACMADAVSGSFTIPPQVLQSLPSTTTSASLGLLTFGPSATFATNGLDYGFAYGGFETVTELASYGSNTGPQIASLTLNPSTTSGTSVQATVTLSGAAPAGGATVALSASSTLVSIPSTLTIPAGSSSANFTVNVSTASATQMVTLAAAYQGNFSQAVLTVNPQTTTVTGFNGTYTGSYSGKTSGGASVSGSVTATVNNGALTVTQPGSGNGTVSANGQATFGVDLNGTATCNFSGSLTASGSAVTGTGTFSCTNPTITGTWTVTREAAPAVILGVR